MHICPSKHLRAHADGGARAPCAEPRPGLFGLKRDTLNYL